MRIQHCWLVAILCLSCSLIPAVIVSAQDPFGDGADPFGTDPFAGDGTDPFGDGSDSGMDAGDAASGNPFGTDAGAGNVFSDAARTSSASSTDVSATESDPDPIVALLRARPPQTPTEMAEGLTWLVRIGRWDEVGRLLDRVASESWSANQQAELARAAGSNLWIRLRGQEAELSDTQKQMAASIASLPAKLSRDPKWIDQWIDKLGSEDAGQRRLAQLRLQDGGRAAIQRLVQRLLDGDDKVLPEMLAGTCLVFGESGSDALRTATAVKDPERAARVILALPDLPGKLFTAEIATGLNSQALPIAERTALANKVAAKFGSLPQPSAIQEFLDREFDNRLVEYFEARARSADLQDYIWRLSPDGNSVVADLGPSEHRELERLGQFAALRSQQTTEPAVMTENAVAMLQRAYQLNPGLEVESQAPGLAILGQNDPTPGQADVNWKAIFTKATKWQMHGAAIRALQLMSSNANPATADMNFISDLLDDPRPMIRYSALEAVAKLDPVTPYRGSEQAIKTALEMTQLGAGPHSLVIGLHTDLRSAAREQIAQITSGGVSVANSGRAALAILDSAAPIELIFVVDRVNDLSLFELLQRLRNTAKGKSVPLAVLADKVYAHERRLIDRMGGVVTGVLTSNGNSMTTVVESLLAELDTEPLSDLDRTAFSVAAARFLTNLIENRERYSFYPLGNYREQLISTASSFSDASQITVLSGLGTRAAQWELVQIAARPNLPEDRRIAAANAFGKSLRTHGNQLDQAKKAQCYELYNKWGPADQVSVRVLGYILDTIEARLGKRDWPERL